MKKNDIFLILGLVVVLVLGFFVMKGDVYEPGYKLPLTLEGEPGLHQLTYKEFKEKVDNDDEFVFIVERASCSHCVTYMPIAKKFAEDNKVPMYYVDTDTFSEEEFIDFEDSIDFFDDNERWGTPTTIVLAGKETVYFLAGTAKSEDLETIYDEYFEMGE